VKERRDQGERCRRAAWASVRAALRGAALGILLSSCGAQPLDAAEQLDAGGWCTQDEQCAAGEICSIGRCSAGCRSDAGCPAGSECRAQRCTPRPDAGPGQDAGALECDGGEPLLVCADEDGDGHGDPARAARVCPAPAPGWSPLCDDCDDSRGEAYPGAPELCNGRDDDCDGRLSSALCDGCPEDMAAIDGRFCVDRWEASRPDATADSAGHDDSSALARPGVLPWQVNPMSRAALSSFEQACRAAGKRSCTADEWGEVCSGSEQNLYAFGAVWDREACNDVDTFCDDHCTANGIAPCDLGADCGYRYGCYQVQPTGSFPRCVTAAGVFDVNGNVWEVVPDGSARGYQVRGGAFNCANAQTRLQCSYDAGWDALYAGFRCCRDLAP